MKVFTGGALLAAMATAQPGDGTYAGGAYPGETITGVEHDVAGWGTQAQFDAGQPWRNTPEDGAANANSAHQGQGHGPGPWSEQGSAMGVKEPEFIKHESSIPQDYHLVA